MTERDTASNPGAQITTGELRDMGCGRQVGRYTLLRRIASGGMAEVYVARSRGISGFEKKVAIKKILPQHANNARFIDMIVDEAKITVSLTHPNIAQVYELGLDGQDYFIVMEFVDGRPLNRLMQRVDERKVNTIPVEHAVYLMSEVAKGLDHAHRQKDQRGNPLQIVHRDVSPQNVLISYQGDVKLIDFGIARAEGRLNQTNAGVIKGKLRYLAPEIAAGDEPDGRADVFCCGIVLFECLTGEAMFAPKSDLEAIEMATQARVRSPRACNSKVPPALDEIVMRALAKDREERYQTAKLLHKDLRRFLNENYPAYVSSELGDFMHQMFEKEMVDERRIDARAEELAQRAIGSEFEEEPPTLAGGPELFLPGRDRSMGYRQLVTRLGIGGEPNQEVRVAGADGGRAMVVVPADPSERPLIDPRNRSDAGRTLPPREVQFTLPPKDLGRGQPAGDGEGWSAGAEPTVRTENPFSEAPDSKVPTVTGIPAGADDKKSDRPSVLPVANLGRASSNGSARVAVWEERESEVVVPEPTATKEPSLPEIRLRSGPPVGYLIAFVVLVVSLGTAMLIYRPVPREVIEPHPDPEPIHIDPVAIDGPEPAVVEQEPGSIALTVKPEVPIKVEINGRVVASRQMPPLVISDLTPDQLLNIEVSADGYRTETRSRRVRGGEEVNVIVNLSPATGTLVFRGLEGGSVWVSKGKRQSATEFTGVPLKTPVKVKVIWPGAKSWTHEVEVTEPEPTFVDVPKPKYLPKGWLIINSRPMSTVYIDGKKLGTTPFKKRMPPGRYRIMLKGPRGQKKTFSRRVNAGKGTRFTYRW